MNMPRLAQLAALVLLTVGCGGPTKQPANVDLTVMIRNCGAADVCETFENHSEQPIHVTLWATGDCVRTRYSIPAHQSSDLVVQWPPSDQQPACASPAP
jgi:hypothetical protein